MSVKLFFTRPNFYRGCDMAVATSLSTFMNDQTHIWQAGMWIATS